ncbi:symmetrical bis(5'-nucleosyl)-tetraphosphatase [Inmirania thermothiophila]|uniref:bis(5'-nucleosyl)-tetraphosphatase (symmetrical) n=1 Tax=Inmirania thermothiophila TaxID=1750597 RepID=A0A3N1Y7C9_9GAMM|nr:symmetrical bis(5'-nucleosyl)-tetraphosphatase [Inmirania thermothiophila]ROR34660.1 bis(5'nucleosyl)-tetraphosphatase ApaH [Inmirania thermothiophila]
MALWAVGDVQGCREALARILHRIGFDPSADRLWLVGDLVARGPDSAGVLRLMRDLGEAAVCVLGNHDLHLLALAEGVRGPEPGDALDVLEAPDAAELLTWLHNRPLLHRDEALGLALVHAGVPPGWDLEAAAAHAAEVEAWLRGGRRRDLLAAMYGDEPARWDEALAGAARLRFIVNALTRIRLVTADGALALDGYAAPEAAPPGLVPWFDHPDCRVRGLVFGHWSTAGLRATRAGWCLDSGCVWGGRLSALRLDARPPELVQVDCPRRPPQARRSRTRKL